MKTFFSQNKILIWLVAFLLVLNICAIGSILYYKGRTTENVTTIMQHPTHERHATPGEGRFFRNFLGLDETQFRKFSAARNRFHIKLTDLNEELAIKRAEFLKELNRKNPDMVKIRKISDEIGNLHAAMRMETGRYYLQLKEICNPEQQEKLYHFFLQTMEGNDMLPSPSGRGGMHRRFMRNHAIRQNNDSI